jgi:hypothetical protein
MSRPIIEIDGLGKKYRIRGQREFGFVAALPFERGPLGTIEWYLRSRPDDAA